VVKIVYVGSKPGEKLFEELLSAEETRRAIELDRYFSITPAFRGIYREIEYRYDAQVDQAVEQPYVSDLGPFLGRAALRELLHRHRLLETDGESISPRERNQHGEDDRGQPAP
jgi:hypothetical protein